MIQVEVEKSRVPRRPSTTWEEDSEIKTLEYVFSDLLLNMNFSNIEDGVDLYVEFVLRCL